MESVVENVEDERETEGCPADSQLCENGGGSDRSVVSLSCSLVNSFEGQSSPLSD